MRRTPIPQEWRGRAVATAAFAARGLPKFRANASDVEHPHHGVLAFGAPDETTLDRCRRYAPALLDDQWFSHRTAAELWRLALPRASEPLHVAVLDPRTPPRRPGVRGHRVSDVRTGVVAGLPVVSAPDAWCQLGTRLRFEDLVAVGDSILGARHRAPLASVDELRDAVDRHAGKRGMARVRAALHLVREGAESRPESLLRLAIMAGGLPEPEIAPPVAVAGGLVLHPDLGYRGARLAIEYEGDGHRTSAAQWRMDVHRAELLADAGWSLVRVTAHSLFTARAELLALIARRYRVLLP